MKGGSAGLAREDLRPALRCANPGCENARHGRASVLILGTLAPGSVVEVRCRRCGWWTRAGISERGGMVLMTRPPRAPTDAEASEPEESGGVQ